MCCAGFVRKTAQVPAGVSQCAVAVDIGVRSSKFSIAVTASITGAVMWSAKPAPVQLKLVDVTKLTTDYLLN